MVSPGIVVSVLLLVSTVTANKLDFLLKFLAETERDEASLRYLQERQEVTTEHTVYGPLCIAVSYKLFLNPLSWEEARQACEDDGGMLAIIRDQTVHQFIKDYITEAKLKSSIAQNGKGLWIGLNDKEEEGRYVWVDGEVLDSDDPDTYAPWADGEPNNNEKKDSNGQDCVQLWKSRDFAFDDAYCENVVDKGYICQYTECDPTCAKCA
ncbi:C-type lectin BfL-2-like [Ptychodera flava]|uniref:C-type lectin BfL-2-like n=1 Tax=Ptychodera flava TaxID=63121 RepID=UPI00396A88A3